MFNHSSNLYDSEWLALVFVNRNKNYGAYALRSQSANNLIKAFFIVMPIFVFAFVGPTMLSNLKKADLSATDTTMPPVEIAPPIHQMKKVEAEPAPAKAEEAAPKVIAPKVKTKAMSANIKVVKDDLVTLSPPTTEDLKGAVIGSTTKEGVEGKGNAPVGDGEIGGGEGLGGAGTGNGTEIHEAAGVDVFPEFPGGMNAWAKYIQRNLRYPNMAQEAAIQGKVFLSFVVEKDGSITDVKVIKGIGYGCDDEAIRVIKKSPRWKAGMQNNLPVRVRYNMPISYMMQN